MAAYSLWLSAGLEAEVMKLVLAERQQAAYSGVGKVALSALAAVTQEMASAAQMRSHFQRADSKLG